MRSQPLRKTRWALSALGFSLMAVSGLAAQGRVVLPEGSVILVRTTSPLQSANARTGQTFETVVIDAVGADNYTVIPSGSRIRGTMTYVQPATRNRSGVIEVSFDRLIMADGSEMAINGKLTSTDAAERRQIENDPNARVVFVGGRGIAGAGSAGDPASTLLVALGNLLSGSSNVNVASGTTLAVQLEQPVTLRGRGRAGADNSLFTSAEYIRAAQQALARLNYYRGGINGQLNTPTQRALFEFQIDRNITATGNLDWRTARALGINISDTGTGGTGGTAGMPSVDQIASIRRNAQSVLGDARAALGISAMGRLSPSRNYSDADFELWFALSSFADNTSLFEQLVRQSSNSANTTEAARALATAARRVETAMQRANASTQVRNGWSSLMSQMSSAGLVYR